MTEVVRDKSGFEPLETYIWQRQNTVAQYIVKRSIFYLCEVAERKQGGVGRDVVVVSGGT